MRLVSVRLATATKTGAAPRDSRRLLLSIHDVSPRFEGAVDRLRNHLSSHAPPENLALLVVPDHWGDAPIVAGSAFAARLRNWAEQGAEIFLHGWFHRDSAPHESLLARSKARHLTAGEGEFLDLARTDAADLMSRGQRLLEDITGKTVAGFIAPAWLYGPGALAALTDCGFALAEDHWKLWQPVTGRVLARSPVLTWASRSRTRIASSLVAARVLPPMLRAAPVARVGVHPGDVAVPAIMASIDHAVARLCRTHRAARYADLIPAESSSCVS